MLRALDLLDTPSEPIFDRITRMLALALKVPVALVSLVDMHRLWFKSRVGEDADEVPREMSMCASAILQPVPMVIDDTHNDVFFKNSPLVTGMPYIRFYAGMPILTSAGKAIGTLCAIDTVPRTLTQQEIDVLVDLAAFVSEEIQKREVAMLARRLVDRARKTAEESDARFRSIFEYALVGISMVAPDGGLLSVNDAFCDIVGYRRDELAGLRFQDITHPDDVDIDVSLMQRVLSNEIDRYQIDKRYLRKDGAWIWVRLSVTRVSGTDGKPNYFISIVEDIQARKEAEAALAALRHDLEVRVEQRTQQLSTANEQLQLSMEQQAHFQCALAKREAELSAIIENSNDAYVCVGEDGVISAWNHEAHEVFGWSAQEAIGRPLDELIIAPELRAAHRAGIQRYLVTGNATKLNRRIELPAIRRDGSHVPMEVRVQVLERDGKTIFSAFLHDISERKLIEQVREREARHDALTGLPNRRALFEMLPLALARAQRNDTALVLFFLDLDGFKEINDALGHEAGDQVLQVIAHRLSSSLRKMDSVARLAGDEFTVLLEGLASGGQQDALAIAEKLLASICEPIAIGAHPRQISASIGMAFHLPGIVISADALLKIADTAMYEAKRAGKSMICMA